MAQKKQTRIDEKKRAIQTLKQIAKDRAGAIKKRDEAQDNATYWHGIARANIANIASTMELALDLIEAGYVTRRQVYEAFDITPQGVSDQLKKRAERG